MNYFKKVFLPLFAIVFVFSSIGLCAQEKEKSGLNKKLSELKGKVEKITVKVDGKDLVFEGKEAETLAKKMRTGSGAQAIHYSIGKPGKTAKVFTITEPGDKYLEEIDEVEICSTGDCDSNFSVISEDHLDKDMKKIKLEKNDGKTKLSVTTLDENGKEVTKEYEGEEADKYLKENNIGNDHYFIGKKGKVSAFWPGKLLLHKTKTPKRIFIEKTGDEDSGAEIIIHKSDKKLKKDVIIKEKTKIEKEEKEK